MKFIHFFYVPFTGLGNFNGYRGDKWLKHRIKIFMSFVVPSLLSQRSRDFYIWISWRPEEKDNPIVRQFQDMLSHIRGFNVFHTFGGLCFWDDKYNDKTAEMRLLTNLAQTLPNLKNIVHNSDYVLMTIQPSDDMYLPGTVKKLHDTVNILLNNEPTQKHVIGWKQGYIMNYGTKELAEYSTIGWKTDEISTYHTNTIPPFFTIVFPKEDFLDPHKHYKYTGPYKSHEHIADYFTYYDIGGRGFIVGTHGANISTVYTHRYKGRIIQQGERDLLFMQMGIYFSNTYFVKQPIRLFIRSIFNKLPFQDSFKRLYKTMPPQWQKL